MTAVIVSYQSKKFLADCLRSLQAQSLPCAQIIVVDNHSGDGSVALCRDFPGVQVIALERNIGYGAAANMAIRQAVSDMILVANPDTIFDGDFHRRVTEAFAGNPGLGLLAPLILRFDRKTVDSAGQRPSLGMHPLEIGFNHPLTSLSLSARAVFSVCGAATVFSRQALERLRLATEYYDEDFFLFWEDFDIGWRAQLLALPVRFEPLAVVYHYRSGTLPEGRKFRWPLSWQRDAESKFHLVKNRYLTMIKNFRFRRWGWRIPFMAFRDALWLPPLLLSSPAIIPRLWRERACFANAWRKRRLLKSA